MHFSCAKLLPKILLLFKRTYGLPKMHFKVIIMSYHKCSPVLLICNYSLQKSNKMLDKASHLISFPYSFDDMIIESVHAISNNVVCATSKASDHPAHTRSLIRAFAGRLSIL